MWLSERPAQTGEPEKEPPTFPSPLAPGNLSRALSRRTLPALPSAESTERRDPLYVALPPGVETAVILEASAIRESEVGQMAMKCLTSMSDSEGSNLRTNVMVFLNNLDRVGITKDLIVATGDFSRIDWSLGGESHAVQSPYGNRAIMHAGANQDSDQTTVATIDKAMVLVGRNRENAELSVDRLEDRAPIRIRPT